jgi:glycerate 2-kinase
LKILVAPNAFKNSLTATQVADAIIFGLKTFPEIDCVSFPIGDGGDGTGTLLNTSLRAEQIDVQVKDPLGRDILSSFGYVRATKTAIIEMADASGIKLLTHEERDVMKSNSYGTGQLIQRALDFNSGKIILCVGGSATVDGGIGILSALGVKILDSNDTVLQPMPGNLLRIERLDASEVNPALLKVDVIVLCDVKNPLLGEQGAAKVFGPQKGASDSDIEILESGLTKLSTVLRSFNGSEVSTLSRGGAAGGVAATLNALLGAKLLDGIEYFLNVTSFNQRLEECDVVITGEGRIDDQTLQGKGPFGVAKRAKEKNKKVIGIAGSVTHVPELDGYFDRLISINKGNETLAESIRNTRQNLITSVMNLAREIL